MAVPITHEVIKATRKTRVIGVSPLSRQYFSDLTNDCI